LARIAAKPAATHYEIAEPLRLCYEWDTPLSCNETLLLATAPSGQNQQSLHDLRAAFRHEERQDVSKAYAVFLIDSGKTL
jgi:hypothetical protein